MIDSSYDPPLELCNQKLLWIVAHIDLDIYKSIRVGVVPRLETFDGTFKSKSL